MLNTKSKARNLIDFFESEHNECQCFVRYTRIDITDPNSPFCLSGFNLLHTHDL